MGISIRPASLGGSASVPNATTTTAGKVRLATIAEAQAGTSELIAVTPAGLSDAIAGIVGGMEFKGAYDIGIGVPDLSNATKGDYYVVTNVRTNPSDTNDTKVLYGQEWAVGDHLVITEDMGGSVDNAKITKVDNSESISVLGDLLDVALSAEAASHVLVYEDVSGEWQNRQLSVDDLLDVASQTDLTALTLRVDTAEGDITSLDGRLTTAETNISGNDGDIEKLRVTVGVGSNLNYFPDVNATYINSATSFKNADSLLDDQVKINADGISANASNFSAYVTSNNGALATLQNEVDRIETGAGLEANGTYTANASTNYLTTATSLKGADEALDAKLKETRDLVDTLGTNSVASVNGETPVAGDVTLGGVHIDTAHTATNYTAAGADLDSHLAGIDSALLTESTARANADSTLQSNIDAEATTRANADTAEATTRANADTALQTELDATQAGAGLEANGAYSANVSTNYLTTATSLKGADEALDAKLKETRDLVDNLGANNVSSVNGETPVAGDVTLGGVHIDTAHTATNYTAAGADLDSHLAGIDTKVGEVQAELDATQTGAGLTNLGSYVPNTLANYITAATSLKSADEALDTQLKVVTDITDTLGTAATKDAGSAIGEVVLLGDVGGNAALPAVDGSQLTGITVDLSSGSIGDLGDVTLTTPAEGDALILNATGDFVNTALAPIATSGDAVDATSAHTAVNYTAAASDVDSHLAGIDTQFGSVNTSLAAHLSEINATQVGAGLEDDGSYVAPAVDGNLLGAATSLMNADEVLAGHVFTNLRKHSAEFPIASITSSQSGTAYSDAMYIIPMGSNALTINLPDATDAEELLNAADGFAVSNRSANTVTVALGVQTANIGGIDFEVYFGGELESDPATEYDALITSITVPPRTTLYFAMDRHTVGGSLNRYVFYPRKIDSLAQMSDVDLTGLADGDALVYSATNGRFEVSPLGTSNVQTVNSVAPVGGNVTLGGADIDTAHTAVYYTAASADLDTHIAGIDNAFLARAIVDNDIMTGAGLENDGSYLANGSTNYLTTATSLKGADEALDTQVKTNADNIALKANIASPTLTGTPTAPTAAQGTNTTQIATTAYVKTELASLSTTAQGAEGVIQTSDGSGNFVASQWKVPSANGHLTPSSSSTYDIGTASARARDLFADNVKLGASSLAVSVDGTSGRLISGGGGTALTADSAEVVLASDIATVATSGDYADLSNAPTSFINSAEFITDANPLNIVAGKHYIMGTATGSSKTLTLPSVTANGQYVRVTNWGLGELVVQVDQADTDAYLLVGQNIVQGGSVTIESKATVDLFGFNYSQGGTDYSPAWGVYFSSSIELNTKSFSTTGQLAYYDATAQELKAGDLGDLTFSFAPSNYDNTRGGTVTGDAVGDHFGGVDDELGVLDGNITTLDGVVVKSINTLTPTAGAVTIGGANIDTAHTASDYTAASAALDDHLAGIDTRLAEKVNAADGLNGLDDVDLTTPATDGQILLFDGVSSTFKPGPPPAPVADETTLGLVELATDAEAQAATANDRAIVPANLAALDLDTFSDVAYPSAPTDGQVLRWVNANSRWEPGAPAAPKVTSDAPGSTYSITTHEGIEEVYLLTPSADCTVSIPTAADAGSGYKYNVKNLSSNEITLNVTIDGAASLVLGYQNASATIVSDGTSWYVI